MNNTPPVSEDKQFSELNQVQKNWKIQKKKQKIENEKKIIKQTKNIVYIICHGLMLPSMVEIPGGRIIYPNGIAANGVHDPILFWRTVCILNSQLWSIDCWLYICIFYLTIINHFIIYYYGVFVFK